jgi:hypothetical protein
MGTHGVVHGKLDRASDRFALAIAIRLGARTPGSNSPGHPAGS